MSLGLLVVAVRGSIRDGRLPKRVYGPIESRVLRGYVVPDTSVYGRSTVGLGPTTGSTTGYPRTLPRHHIVGLANWTRTSDL